MTLASIYSGRVTFFLCGAIGIGQLTVVSLCLPGRARHLCLHPCLIQNLFPEVFSACASTPTQTHSPSTHRGVMAANKQVVQHSIPLVVKMFVISKLLGYVEVSCPSLVLRVYSYVQMKVW